MNAKRMFVGSLGALALSFAWLACSSSGTSCPLGSESCPCTAGNGCDPGLSCFSSRCVKVGPATGAGTGAPGSTGAATGSASTTASSSTTGGSTGTPATTSTTSTTGTTGTTAGTGGSGGSGGARPDAGPPTTTAGTGGATGKGGAGGAGPATGGNGGSVIIGTGGAGGSGPINNGKLGAACKADADCGPAPYICIKPTDALSAQSPGGVGNGICSVDCTVNQFACSSLGAICIAIDVAADGTTVTKANCFESCNIGPPVGQPPAFKCHGRQDVACEPVNAAETLFGCIPLCERDADCGARKCDPSSGLCVDTPMAGKTVGSGCTVVRGMANNECAGGLCLPIEAIPDAGTTTPGICTALCRLGSPEACGFRFTPLDAGPPMGGCLLPWGDDGYNTGDLGLCLQLCESNNDCSYRAANWVCRTDSRIVELGNHGICLVPNPG